MLKFQWNHLAITFIRWRCRSFCEITTATHNHLNNICVVALGWLNQLACMEFLAVSSSVSFPSLHFLPTHVPTTISSGGEMHNQLTNTWTTALRNWTLWLNINNIVTDTPITYPESLSTCFPDQWPPPAAATFHFISILRNTIIRKSVCLSVHTHSSHSPFLFEQPSGKLTSINHWTHLEQDLCGFVVQSWHLLFLLLLHFYYYY